MAQRRMFSPSIVGSDAFLEMPTSSRELYFQLGMYADDDGFVNPRRIMRMLGASDDDLKVLLTKRFVLPFQSGVVVIKHWKINNLVRKDWYRETMYLEEKKQLKIKENGSYTELVNEMLPNSLTQDRIGKDRIGKDRTRENQKIENIESPLNEQEKIELKQEKDYNKVITYYYDLVETAYKTTPEWRKKDYERLSELMRSHPPKDIVEHIKWYFSSQNQKTREFKGYLFCTIFSKHSMSERKRQIYGK